MTFVQIYSSKDAGRPTSITWCARIQTDQLLTRTLAVWNGRRSLAQIWRIKLAAIEALRNEKTASTHKRKLSAKGVTKNRTASRIPVAPTCVSNQVDGVTTFAHLRDLPIQSEPILQLATMQKTIQTSKRLLLESGFEVWWNHHVHRPAPPTQKSDSIFQGICFNYGVVVPCEHKWDQSEVGGVAIVDSKLPIRFLHTVVKGSRCFTWPAIV